MKRGTIRVVKVGGSLLRLPQLASALRGWIARQPRGIDILIAGGGALADQLRDVDRRLSLGPRTSHWLCVSLLGVTAELLAALLPDADYQTRLPQLRRTLQDEDIGRVVVFNVRSFLRRREAHLPGIRLPQDWTATSDSIAARLAEVVGAGELVLLKPALWRGYLTVEAAAEGGYVDRHFPRASMPLGVVRCVDLRTGGFPEVRLVDRRRAAGAERRS